MIRLSTKYIVVHCADTPAIMDIGVKEIREWHTLPPPKGNGWSDVGYHFVIRRDGTLEKGREINDVGSHVKGFNSCSIGVCLVGGKGGNNFTQDQFKTLKRLLKDLASKYKGAEVLGHRDLNAGKECPSFDVKKWYNSVKGD